MASHSQTDTAMALWRRARWQVEGSTLQPRPREYEWAARIVCLSLSHYTTVAELVDAYYRDEGESEADTAVRASSMRLRLSVIEDYGYWLRYQALAQVALGSE